jgi:F0F1-type ATP synthase membrane subunit c/vacuolar-type H+-ATPase subunit K
MIKKLTMGLAAAGLAIGIAAPAWAEGGCAGAHKMTMAETPVVKPITTAQAPTTPVPGPIQQ